MRMIEAVQKVRYAHKDRAIGDQFDAETKHAQALVLIGKAKYVGDGSAAEPVRRGPGRPKKGAA